MRKIFLITGFNNWGKTTLLFDLFKIRAFRKGRLHAFGGQDFLVLPKSNDDLGRDGYIKHYEERLEKVRARGLRPRFIASAFCPTKEPRNFSPEILHKLYRRDQIEIILLEYKWCGHAKLLLKEIEQFYLNEANVRIHRVGATAYPARLAAVQDIITANL